MKGRLGRVILTGQHRGSGLVRPMAQRGRIINEQLFFKLDTLKRPPESVRSIGANFLAGIINIIADFRN